MLAVNVLLLIVEVIYYSSFLKFCRKEGKVGKYLLVSILVTVVAMIVGTNNLLSYILLVLTFLFGLKYIVRLKTSLYDMFIIFIMLFVKLVIELICFVILYLIFKSYPAFLIFMTVIKFLFLIVTRNKLCLFYNRLKELWLANTFKIRYVFICCTYVYVIITAFCKLFLK